MKYQQEPYQSVFHFKKIGIQKQHRALKGSQSNIIFGLVVIYTPLSWFLENMSKSHFIDLKMELKEINKIEKCRRLEASKVIDYLVGLWNFELTNSVYFDKQYAN